MGERCAGVLVAALVASCGDGTFDAATLDARARELQPAMEGVLGEWPGGPACVCVTAPGAMAKLLAGELTANLEAASGGSNAFIPRMAKAQADLFSLYV